MGSLPIQQLPDREVRCDRDQYPLIAVEGGPERYLLRASLELDQLEPRSTSKGGDGMWRLGLSAIIEETSGHRSYWALAHPPGKPDFHHHDCFAVEVS